jgi:uncharacterized DUF497 family protein
MENLLLFECTGFDWDTGNQEKNWGKHGVSTWECEQVFFNEPLLLLEDIKHSQTEKRIYALGKTDIERKLFILFTIQNKLIRIISARDMNKKERSIYEKA